MRDEFDARFWNDHHQDFGDAVDEAAGKLRRAFRFRLPANLLAAVAAVAISSVTVLSAIGPVQANTPTAPTA